ncbi:MAG: hypothetical protein J6Y51_03690 [Bacteroidaceae bacterium]|nr:hypothetical protein [Bacteroidaceae bacterium]
MKTRFFLAIAIMTLFAAVASAQSAIIYGSLTLPRGAFGEKNIYRNAFSSDYGNQGGAQTGFNIGVKYMKPFPDSEFSWFLSADFFYNGLDSDLKDEIGRYTQDATQQIIRETIQDNSFVFDYFELKFPHYYNIPLMAGVNCSLFNLSKDCSFWMECGLGANFRKISDLKETVEYNDEHYESTCTFDETFTMAYQASAGLKFQDRIMIGVGYYNLGADVINAKIISNSTGDWKKQKTNEKLEISMLTVRLGLIF